MQNNGGKRLIHAAWGIYLVSMLVPWSAKPFQGWLGGWFWNLLDIFPFVRAVTFSWHGGGELLGLAFPVSAIVANVLMLISPFFVLLWRGGRALWLARVVQAAPFLALLAMGYRLYQAWSHQLPYAWLMVAGGGLWIASMWLLSRGVTADCARLRLG